MLEAALAVAVAAVGGTKQAQLARRDLHGLDLHNQVFRLHAVGTDVLDGTGSGLAGDERQVLGAEESGVKAGRHDVVPRLGAATVHLAAVHLPALDGRMDDGAVEVLRQQQVAAAADDEVRTALAAQQACHFLGLGHGGILQEPAAPGLNAECIVGFQAIVADVFHCYVVSFTSFHCPPMRLNVSSSSMPLAMPRMTKIFVLPEGFDLP